MHTTIRSHAATFLRATRRDLRVWRAMHRRASAWTSVTVLAALVTTAVALAVPALAPLPAVTTALLLVVVTLAERADVAALSRAVDSVGLESQPQ